MLAECNNVNIPTVLVTIPHSRQTQRHNLNASNSQGLLCSLVVSLHAISITGPNLKKIVNLINDVEI